MVVCSCRRVSDRAVREAIDEGARTVPDVTARCAAASRCGGCSPELERLINEHAARRPLQAVGAA